MSLLFRPVAAEDIEEAALWYEGQRGGLGDEFLGALRVTLETVADHQHLFQVVHRDTRRANLRRFPYCIFYRVMGADVVVVGCFHGSRNPRRWKDRR